MAAILVLTTLVSATIGKEKEEETSGIRPYIMEVLREDAYQNKPSILLSIDAYLYRRGA
jgi:hypothetical protein